MAKVEAPQTADMANAKVSSVRKWTCNIKTPNYYGKFSSM